MIFGHMQAFLVGAQTSLGQILINFIHLTKRQNFVFLFAGAVLNLRWLQTDRMGGSRRKRTIRDLGALWSKGG